MADHSGRVTSLERAAAVRVLGWWASPEGQQMAQESSARAVAARKAGETSEALGQKLSPGGQSAPIDTAK